MTLHPSASHRQLAAMETRKKLIEAAKKIISERGLVNTSIEEITKACGVSTMFLILPKIKWCLTCRTSAIRIDSDGKKRDVSGQ